MEPIKIKPALSQWDELRLTRWVRVRVRVRTRSYTGARPLHPSTIWKRKKFRPRYATVPEPGDHSAGQPLATQNPHSQLLPKWTGTKCGVSMEPLKIRWALSQWDEPFYPSTIWKISLLMPLFLARSSGATAGVRQPQPHRTLTLWPPPHELAQTAVSMKPLKFNPPSANGMGPFTPPPFERKKRMFSYTPVPEPQPRDHNLCMKPPVTPSLPVPPPWTDTKCNVFRAFRLSQPLSQWVGPFTPPPLAPKKSTYATVSGPSQ